jgi:hypothetical protein
MTDAGNSRLRPPRPRVPPISLFRVEPPTPSYLPFIRSKSYSRNSDWRDSEPFVTRVDRGGCVLDNSYFSPIITCHGTSRRSAYSIVWPCAQAVRPSKNNACESRRRRVDHVTLKSGPHSSPRLGRLGLDTSHSQDKGTRITSSASERAPRCLHSSWDGIIRLFTLRVKIQPNLPAVRN